MFVCLECGKKFRSTNAAYKASMNGCPKCGGVDIDLDMERNHEAVPRNAAKKRPLNQSERTPDEQIER